MKTSTSVPKRRTAMWQQHWRDEADAAFLYRLLAKAEENPERRELYQRFAEVEAHHTDLWQQLLTEQGIEMDTPRPSLRIRFLAGVASLSGTAVLLPFLLREEGREVKVYLALHRESRVDAAKATALTLARESAKHAEALSRLTGTPGEPWHRIESGGFINDIVYGFNDGLTANF